MNLERKKETIMKKKIIFSIIFTVMLIGVLGNSFTIKAEESFDINNIPKIIVDGESIEGEIIDGGDDYVKISYFVPADDVGKDDIRLKAWPGYSIRNVRASTTSTNYNFLISNDVIAKGGSKSMTVKWSRTSEVNGSAAIGASDLNAAVGFKASASVTLSKTYKYTCPNNVKSCTIKYYPRITTYKFDEYFLEGKTGTKSGTVLTGFHQVVTLNK